MPSKSATAWLTAEKSNAPLTGYLPEADDLDRQTIKERPEGNVMKGKSLARFGLILGLAASMFGWTSAVRAETITVTHWGGQFYGVPYAVAMEKGFFKKNGVDVTGILTAAGGGTAVRNTLAGGI